MTRLQLRRTGSALSAWERPALSWLAARMPAWVTPDGLTLVGFVGALVCATGYAIAGRAPWGLLIASAGVVINWFGDSLDGTLARYRKIERPRYGYFLDNGVDMVEQLAVAIGIGLSGYVRWDLCFLALSVLFMISSLSALRACVSPVHKLAYGGWGLTELRLSGLALNGLFAWAPPGGWHSFGLPLSYPNLIALGWTAINGGVFVVSFARQARELAREEPPQTWRAPGRVSAGVARAKR